MEHESFVPGMTTARLAQALRSPDAVRAALPGWQPDAPAGDGTAAGRLRLRVGGTTITYRGTVTVSGEGPDFTVAAEGSEVRGGGRVTVDARIGVVTVVQPEPGVTLVWRGEAEATGRVAALEPAAVESAVRRLLDRFCADLAAHAPAGDVRGTSGGTQEAAAAAAGAHEAVPDAQEPEPPAEDAEPGPEAAGADGAEGGREGEREAETVDGAEGGREGEPEAETVDGAEGGREGEREAEVTDGAEGGSEGEPEVGGVDGTKEGSEEVPEAEVADGVKGGPGEAPGPEAAGADGAEGGREGEREAETVDGAEGGSEEVPEVGGVDGSEEEPEADVVDDLGEPVPPAELDDFDLVEVEVEVPESAAALDDLVPPAEAAHARRTMIGRSAEEVDHAPPRGRYAPVPAPDGNSAAAALRWAAPVAAALVASAVVVGRVLRRRR